MRKSRHNRHNGHTLVHTNHNLHIIMHKSIIICMIISIIVRIIKCTLCVPLCCLISILICIIYKFSVLRCIVVSVICIISIIRCMIIRITICIVICTIIAHTTHEKNIHDTEHNNTKKKAIHRMESTVQTIDIIIHNLMLIVVPIIGFLFLCFLLCLL